MEDPSHPVFGWISVRWSGDDPIIWNLDWFFLSWIAYGGLSIVEMDLKSTRRISIDEKKSWIDETNLKSIRLISNQCYRNDVCGIITECVHSNQQGIGALCIITFKIWYHCSCQNLIESSRQPPHPCRMPTYLLNIKYYWIIPNGRTLEQNREFIFKSEWNDKKCQQ